MQHITTKTMTNWLLRLNAIVVVTFTVVAASSGQVSTGTLTGTVTDSTGAVVPKCGIAATSAGRGEIYRTVTDSAGLYSLPSMPPGIYRVAVSGAGFGTQVATIEILLDRIVRRDFSMSVSATSSMVEVEASSTEALETESHEIAATLGGDTLQELPQTGRDVFSKLEAEPNVAGFRTTNSNPDDIHFFGADGNSLSIGGTTNGNTSYLQDGVLNYNLLTKTANFQPTPEDVMEATVQANGASARYDEPGVVNIVTKGGTNSFHGQVYDFLQNDFFNAMGYFNKTPTQQRYNQFGGSVGGPILKSKLQFFFAYDGERQHSDYANFQLIPTQAMFAGNFGSITIKDPTTGQPFPNNTIPSDRISSFAKAVIPYYPTPNGSYLTGAANYYSVQGSRFNYDSYLGRMDYNLGSSDSMYGAYETTDPLGTGTSWIEPSIFNNQNIQSATNAYVQETHVFSPTFVNVARFGYNHSQVYVTVAGAGKANYTQQFGVPFVTPASTQDEPPTVGFSQYSGFGSQFSPDGAIQRNLQYADELNKVIGKHSIFFGVEADQMNMNASWVIWNNAEFDFNGQYTGNSVADFLLGYPWQAIGGIGYTQGNFNQWEVMPYVQDDWKLNRRLTLNLGLRYDFYQAPTDSSARAGVFNPATNSVTKGAYSQSHDTFAPRVGAAYALNDKTVLRGGYGIYYSTFEYNELQFMLAHYPNFSLEWNTFGVNQLVPVASTFFPPVPGNSALAPFTTAANMPTPMVHQWNVTVQRSLGSNWIASLTYLGNKAIHQEMRFNANQAALPSDPNNPTPIQTRRPYPNVGDVIEAGDIGWANYNGLQAEISKKFTKGLSLDANYVWSKALDIASTDNWTPRYGRNLRLDYGPSDFDRTHVFKLSDVWEIPVGPGKLLANQNNWFNRNVIGSWQTSEILAISSSTPFSVYANANNDIGGEVLEYANQNCANPYAVNHAPLNWLNKSCFTQPVGTLGNQGRNSLRGPSIMSFDASVSKYFPLTERFKVKFAADFLNAFNHPNWYFAATSQYTTNPAALGQASYFGTPRVIQLSLHAEF